jgi:hypothetical protein
MKVAYLLVVAIGALLIPDPRLLVALGAAQILIAAACSVGGRALVVAARKLLVFFIFAALAFAISEGWRGGLEGAGWFVLRILTVVYASMAVRASGEPGEFAAALERFYLPRTTAVSLDATLALLEEDGKSGRGGGQGRGKGKGGGGGRGRGGGTGPEGEEPPGRMEEIRRYLRAIRSADSETLARPLALAIDRAEERIRAENPELESGKARDVAVVAGCAMVLMSLKFMKTLPGAPIAPGHRNVFYLPVFLLCKELTRGRFSASSLGATVGIMGFLWGDGRYGVLEILKHVTPGVVTDLLWPAWRRVARRSVVLLALFGVLLAAARFCTELLVAFAVGVPGSFYAMLTGLAVTHLAAAVGGLAPEELAEGEVAGQPEESDQQGETGGTPE